MKRKSHPPTFSVFFSLFTGLLLTFFMANNMVLASDLDKEARWAEQIEDSLVDGSVIELTDGTVDFIAIDTQAENAKELGVIIMHGSGVHPDWPAVIQPLRVELAEAGWSTLSLQLPVLKNDAGSEEYEPLMKEVPTRVDAGIRYLVKQGVKKVVIVAHSMGARMANYYLSHKKIYQEAQTEVPIVAYVAIGMSEDKPNYVSQIKLPIFELYGGNDLNSVLESVLIREKRFKSNTDYSQKKVPKANHFFDDQNDALVEEVKNFIKKF